jgi:hypothetical protein
MTSPPVSPSPLAERGRVTFGRSRTCPEGGRVDMITSPPVSPSPLAERGRAICGLSRGCYEGGRVGIDIKRGGRRKDNLRGGQKERPPGVGPAAMAPHFLSNFFSFSPLATAAYTRPP